MKAPLARAPRTQGRQGSVLVCMLACLAVVVGILSATLHTALQTRRAMRTQHHLRQTELLLTAGVKRAVRKLSNSENYDGETWRVDHETFPGVAGAEVEITIDPDREDTAAEVPQTNVVVTAKLFVTTQQATKQQTALRRSHEFQFARGN